MSKDQPLRIRDSTAEFLIFTRQADEEGIEVRVAEETVWLTQKLMSELFDKGRSTITEHLRNIFESRELDEKAVCRDFRHTAEDGKAYTSRGIPRDTLLPTLPSGEVSVAALESKPAGTDSKSATAQTRRPAR